MLTTSSSLESDLVAQFRRILPQLLPQVSVLSGREQAKLGDLDIDLQLRLKIGSVEKTCLFEMKASGAPRLIFEAIGRLSIAAKRMPNAYPVVVAPLISKESKQLCKEAGIGYITLSGEAWLQFDTVLIERDLGERAVNWKAFTALPGRLNKIPQTLDMPTRQRRLPFPFSAKASRVLRVFLENPGKTWTVLGLAGEAQVALRLANVTANFLADKLLVKKERGAIALLKPKELLDLWTAEYQFKTFNRIFGYYSFDRSFEEFAQNVKLIGAAYNEKGQDRYALTLFSGASLVAPYTRFSENYLYVAGNPQVWAEHLKLRPVESGANTFLVIPYDEKIFYGQRQIQGVSVVSNIQLYLDLFNFNDRAREQAEVLFKQAIHFPS